MGLECQSPASIGFCLAGVWLRILASLGSIDGFSSLWKSTADLPREQKIQRLHCPLIKEYTLNLIRVPNIF